VYFYDKIVYLKQLWFTDRTKQIVTRPVITNCSNKYIFHYCLVRSATEGQNNCLSPPRLHINNEARPRAPIIGR